ncbi:keratin-associated protein 13-1-like [Orycteropus afer afer]|uniref:Keratin-associated protein 13-1-like n=1 Tax=Orycteropus afer afer TaxID=1230840 RepID=A0AC54Z357_ORYAF|nr:keratin-associated protein 13-1-like [Orycteropus afer afer]
MSYNCCSGIFSSCSLGGCFHYPVPSCVSSSPMNLVYSTDFCSPSTCQLGSSHYRGCQEKCCEPSSCQKSQVVSIPCQTSCFCPRTSRLCSPCLMTYTGSLGFGSRTKCSLGYGCRSCYSLSCGSSRFSPLSYGVCDFPSLVYGSRFCYSNYFPSMSYQSSCYRPTCRSGLY